MDQERNRTRAASAVGVVASHVLLAYALIAGFSLHISSESDARLKLFDIAEPPPPPPIQAARPADSEAPSEAPAPPNLEAEPTPVVAPPPQVRLPLPPAIAAPLAGRGNEASAGASDRAGPGTGAGGSGTGRGGDGAGRGMGEPAVRARLVRGRIRDSDYPRDALRAGVEGTVTVRIGVAASGRVRDCVIVRSSGSPILDAATCRIIRQRFRYEPARDADGREIPDVAGGMQRWWIARRG